MARAEVKLPILCIDRTNSGDLRAAGSRSSELHHGMSRSSQASALPAAVRRRLDLAAAICRKRLADVHFQYALQLVEHTEGELEPRRALDIYARLHKLSAAEAAGIEQEVFVTLGRRFLARPVEGEEGDGQVRWEDPDSTLRQIRRRLRGRVNLELRRWTEFHTGRTETALFWTHVENADEFVDLLDEHRGIADAINLYAERVALSPSWTELIYFMILEQRAPAPADAAGVTASRRIWRAGDARPAALRVVETRRERGRHRAG